MISWQKAPFFRPVAGLLLGILAEEMIATNPIFMILSGLFVLISTMSLYLFRNQFPLAQSIGILISFFLLGLSLQAVDHALPSDHFAHELSDQNYLIGKISEEPRQKKWSHTTINIQGIGNHLDHMINAKGKLSAFLAPEIKEKYSFGDLVFLCSRVEKIRSPVNPYAIDYSKQNIRNGIHYQTFIMPHQIIKIGQVSEWNWIHNMRQAVFQKLRDMAKDPSVYGILTAMILGDRQAIPVELKTAFADTGAIHTLAVSGLHVGIVAMFITLLWQLIPIRSRTFKILKIVFSILAIWLFASLAGASPSVIRASIMFSLFIVDFYWSGNKNSYNFLAFSALIMCVYKPSMIYQISFQFSFLALLSILIFYPKIYRLLPYSKWSLFRFIWGLLAVSFSAQILLFPLSVYYFHQLPTYFWLSSLIAIPITYGVVSLGISVVGLSFLSDGVAQWGYYLLEKLVTLLNRSIYFCHELPYHTIKDIWWSAWEVGFLYLILALCILYVYKASQLRLNALKYAVILWFCYLTLADWQSHHQSKVIVYNTPDRTAIELVDGQTLFSIFGASTETTDFPSSTCKNIALRHHINNHIPVMPDSLIYTRRSYHRDGIFIHKNQVFMLPSDRESAYRGKVDYLIIDEKNIGRVSVLISDYQPKTLVLDKKISRQQIDYIQGIDSQSRNILALKYRPFIELEI